MGVGLGLYQWQDQESQGDEKASKRRVSDACTFKTIDNKSYNWNGA